jgi:undecaprenyl pyrophosphate phosphatase UppP
MKKPTKRQIFAWIGIVILVAMYASTMVFALIKSPNAKALLMASIYCTIAVPVILYGIILITRNARNRKEPGEEPADDPEDGEKKDA